MKEIKISKNIPKKLWILIKIIGIPLYFIYIPNWDNWKLILLGFFLSLAFLGYLWIWVDTIIKFFKQ